MRIKSIKRRLPVLFWGEPRAISIPIEHISPLRAELERWWKPAAYGRPRKPFVFLRTTGPL